MMNSRGLLIVGLFWILFVSTARPEMQYGFRQYQVENGLSNNNVTCCLQDGDGFIWIGTRDGLNCFDGYTFRVFRNSSQTPHSIGSNRINSLTLDEYGTVWIGTNIGLYKYDKKKKGFDSLPFTEQMRVTDVSADHNGQLWFLLENNLVKYDMRLRTYKALEIPGNASITCFTVAPLGRIWVNTADGYLHLLSGTDGKAVSFDLFEHSQQINSRTINSIYSTEDGDRLFIGTLTHGVKVFDINKGSYTDLFRYDQNKAEISARDFIQVGEKEIWIATESGLFIYNLLTGDYTQVRSRPYDPYSLSTNSLYTFCMDREGGVWIGTYSGGMNYYSPYHLFTRYYTYAGENVMQGTLVYDICTDRYGNLWIATEDAGINKLDLQTGIYTNYQSILSHTNIHGMGQDGNKLWVGTYASGIDVIDIPTGRLLRHYTLGDPDYIGRNHIIVNMKKAPDGRLMVATSRGMFQYNEENDRFVFMPQFPTQYRVQSICVDHAGVIWIGTSSDGVYWFDPEKNKQGGFFPETFTTNSSKSINDIYEDKNHNLWLATLEGVRKYDRQTGSFQWYLTEEGLPSDVTFRIFEDDYGYIWITTANGLARMNPETESITNFTTDHGLITNQFNYNSGWKDERGRLYFGMIRGMISFDPGDLKQVESEHPVYFTGMTIYDKKRDVSLEIDSLQATSRIILKNYQSTIHLDFSTLSYLAPEATRYKYAMEGLNANWIDLHNSHEVYFTELSPGNYTLKVNAANISGVWNEIPSELSILVLPPWWLSSWAKGIYLLCCAALLTGVFMFIRHRQKVKLAAALQLFETRKEKELYQAKIEFFIHVAHEIRTPLTLIISPLQKALSLGDLPVQAREWLQVVDKNATRLLTLVTQLLDFRKTETAGYRLNFIQTDIFELANDIIVRFRPTAEQKNLSLSIQANTAVHKGYIDKEACTKIISNLLTNALKYARTHISIYFSYSDKDEQFVIDVVNDGQAIPEEEKERIFEPFFRGESALLTSGTGLGLPLARSLAEMHRGKLVLSDSFDPDIAFRLLLPVNQPDKIPLTDEQPAIAAEEKSYAYDTSRFTVLVVEDNDEMRDFVASEVNALYNVLTATNGEEAIDRLARESVQLIISDIMMPVLDGITLLRKVKSDIEFSHIPVILLTAKNTMQSRLEGLETGADAYLEKPFTLDLLLAQISNLLENRNKLRTYYFKSPLVNMKTMANTKADEHFLEKLNEIINANITDIELDVDKIAAEMNISRPTLYRKINALSNLTPNELIKICRLKKAAGLILEGNMRIYEIAEAVGFNSQSYFSRAFSKQFNMTPSQYAKENGVQLK